jgi:hypothetical protein
MSTVILSGSNVDLSSTSNYSGAALPSNGDTLILRQRTASFTAGLSALSAITLAAFIVESSFTGNLGTTTTPAVIDADDVTWAGTGSLSHVDFGSATIDSVTVTGTGSGASDGLESLRIKGSDIQTAYVLGGSVAIAGNSPLDTASIDVALVVGSNGTTSPSCRIGTGTTIGGITVNSGTLNNDGASPSGAVSVTGGTYAFAGSANHTGTVSLSGSGQMIDRSTGTIDDLTIAGNAIYDASQSPSPKTVTAATVAGGTIKQINGNVTFTAIDFTGSTITVQ